MFSDFANPSKFYFIIAVASTVLFVLKIALFSFTDCDSDNGFDDHGDGGSSFSFLTLQSVLAFLMGFGWIGLAGINEWKFGVLPSFVIAFVVGAAFMFMSAWLMLQVRKLDKIHKTDLNKLLNKKCKTYTGFSPNGVGQIQTEVDGRLATISATNNAADEIGAFEEVKVVSVKDNIIYIEKT
jgi:membrane protein implicated in regulation of membrane protease activity